MDRQGALQCMQDNAGIIKRPLLDLGDRRVLGLDPKTYGTLF
jgi:hypothetical protein